MRGVPWTLWAGIAALVLCGTLLLVHDPETSLWTQFREQDTSA